MLDHAKTLLIVGLFVFSLFQLGQVSTLESAIARYRAEVSELEVALITARESIINQNLIIEEYREEALRRGKDSDDKAIEVLDSLPVKIAQDRKVSATPAQLNNWLGTLFQ